MGCRHPAALGHGGVCNRDTRGGAPGRIEVSFTGRPAASPELSANFRCRGSAFGTRAGGFPARGQVGSQGRRAYALVWWLSVTTSLTRYKVRLGGTRQDARRGRFGLLCRVTVQCRSIGSQTPSRQFIRGRIASWRENLSGESDGSMPAAQRWRPKDARLGVGSHSAITGEAVIAVARAGGAAGLGSKAVVATRQTMMINANRAVPAAVADPLSTLRSRTRFELTRAM